LAAIISQLGTLSGAPNALANSGNVFQNLSQRQQDFESKASAEQKLQGLIGTAAVPGVPFDINNSPLMPVEPVPGTGFAGQAGLESQQVEMLKNLAGVSPETVTKGISDQLFKSGGKNGFKNVRVDDLGNAFGIKNGVFQKIPSLDQNDLFTKFKTVQGTDPGGLPTTELVNPAALSVKQGRITIGKKTPLPTQAEANKIAQTKSSISIINDLRNLMTSKNAPDIGSIGNFVNEMKAGTGITGVLTRMVTDPLTEKQAQLLSKTEALSNQIIQAMRGAQVGPAEQERFERQLPRAGQPRVLFMENLEQSEKNLKLLNNEIKRLRKFDLSNDIKEINNIPRPKTQADFDTLPSGTSFINPKDGKTLIKR